MAQHRGPLVVREGLIVNLDASSFRSAPDASSGWTNLGYGLGSTNVNAKTGSPSLTTLGGVRTWRFTASGQYFESNLIGTDNQPALEATVEAWIYPETEVTTGDRGTIVRVNGNQSLYMSWNKSNLKLSTYWYSHATNGYHETGAAMTRNAWHHICQVHKYSDDACYQYTNMTKTTASGTQADSANYGTEATGQAVEVGMESSGRQFAGGICIVRIYNRALTDSEVIQNYNAVCGRFGKSIVTSV